MTQSEFIKFYCANSEMTEDQLHKFGRFAFPCQCDYGGCQGWQMTNADGVIDEVGLHRLTTTYRYKLNLLPMEGEVS